MDMMEKVPGRAAAFTTVTSVRDDRTQPILRCVSQRHDEAAIDISRRGHRSDARRPHNPSAGLSDERVREYRRRIEDGSYDSPAVAEEVARRMLESGDI